ncbi:AbiH family protein [Macrococcus epidermidis]|uniref:AbiH family protein n=1 Tax=Macrococcus epidermidis TaxID=1902580 RepID=UPI0020B7DE96|nr:AbiH family protein [Macrococcus epidermidis]UTH15051.1 hypothetical protein KFV12_06830 [Macrococcus epidermidis]
MRLTFLIGNGLDLQYGLKTTFNDFFEYIKSNNVLQKENYIYRKFLNKSSKEDWSDFEYILGKLTFDLKKDNVEPDGFIDDLIDFREVFITYMNSQQELFEVNKDENSDIVIDTAKNYFHSLDYKNKKYILDFINQSREVQINILNFNYTDTLKKVLDISNISFSIWNKYHTIENHIYVHRTLDDGTFLGVNDKSQLDSEIFTPLDLDGLIKPRMIETDKDEYSDKLTDIISRSNIIYIFGMSLGDTDKIWWERIKVWLEKSSYNRLIINYYIDDNKLASSKKHLNRKNRIHAEAKNKFYEHFNMTNEEKEIFNEKIYISLNSPNIFNK